MQIRKHALRFSLVFLTLIICLGVFASKLIFIQVFNSSHLANLAE
ncbi:MAG: cell division protein FtsI/penicillin-binding protein 2, partial [Lysobacterales bacterium]